MHTREKAIVQIKEFFNSDEQSLLLTGTHQYRKHDLIIKLINKYMSNKSILIRTSGIKDVQRLFENPLNYDLRSTKAGKDYYISNNIYNFDSYQTSSTWYKTKNKYDYAIVYPIDSIEKDDTLKNLFCYKVVEKIFLCSWHRPKKISVFEKYFQRHVIYDAEEERPDYHQRVLKL